MDRILDLWAKKVDKDDGGSDEDVNLVKKQQGKNDEIQRAAGRRIALLLNKKDTAITLRKEGYRNHSADEPG